MQLNTILLALSAAALIIGIHQALLNGFFQSYWLFMTAGLLFLWYQYRKNRKAREQALRTKNSSNSNQKKKKKRKKRR